MKKQEERTACVKKCKKCRCVHLKENHCNNEFKGQSLRFISEEAHFLITRLNLTDCYMNE